MVLLVEESSEMGPRKVQIVKYKEVTVSDFADLADLDIFNLQVCSYLRK